MSGLCVTQRQVVSRLIAGKSLEQVACELGIGHTAVSARLSSARRRLGASNNLQLAARAIALGIVDLPERGN